MRPQPSRPHPNTGQRSKPKPLWWWGLIAGWLLVAIGLTIAIWTVPFVKDPGGRAVLSMFIPLFIMCAPWELP